MCAIIVLAASEKLLMTTHGFSRGPPRGAQPCRPCVTVRTLVGGSAHQTRSDFGLWEELVIAVDLTG
jgi:hypothetical protein